MGNEKKLVGMLNFTKDENSDSEPDEDMPDEVFQQLADAWFGELFERLTNELKEVKTELKELKEEVSSLRKELKRD